MRLMSSMQPISTRRWPWKESSPVVSVSSTISRTSTFQWAAGAAESPSPLRHCSNCVEDRTHVGARRLKAPRRIHDKIRPATLLVVWDLLRENGIELVHRHAWAFEGARALHVRRRGDHHHRVDALLAAGFEQEGNVQHCNFLATRFGFGEQAPLRLLHEGVNDGLEPFQRCAVAEDTCRELIAIDLAACGCAGKCRLNRRRSFPVVEAMHHRVGVVYGNTFLGKEARRRRLSHAERAGEAEN